MDATRLKLSVPSFRLSQDGSSTYVYYVDVIYGKLHWSVPHRFSDFLALADGLYQSGYDALPPVPPKTLTRSCDVTFLEGRRVMLHNWLCIVCQRPDLRLSSLFLEFLEFELQTSTVLSSSLLPRLLGCCKELRFRVSDCVYVPMENHGRSSLSTIFGSIFASYEENIHLSRLGKVWSLIENDELGSIDLWHLSFDFVSKQQLTEANKIIETSVTNFTHIAHSVLPVRAQALYYHYKTSRIFCGTDTGTIKVFTLKQHSEQQQQQQQQEGEASSISLTFVHLTDLALHHDGVVCLRGGDEDVLNKSSLQQRLLSVGYDNTIRIIDCSTMETLCGGKIQKRLVAGEHLTVGVLEPIQQSSLNTRLFLGSDKGTVFIFNCGTHPPIFLSAFQCDSPITALEIAGFNLLVAHKYQLSVIRLSKHANDGFTTVEHTLTTSLLSGRTIRSIAISRIAPLLFLGHTHSVSIWDCTKYQCVGCFKAHTGGIRRMHLFLASYQRPSLHLLTAGNDGYLKLWHIPPPEDFVLWDPPVPAAASTYEQDENKLLTLHNTKQQTADDDDECLLSSIVSAVPHRH